MTPYRFGLCRVIESVPSCLSAFRVNTREPNLHQLDTPVTHLGRTSLPTLFLLSRPPDGAGGAPAGETAERHAGEDDTGGFQVAASDIKETYAAADSGFLRLRLTVVLSGGVSAETSHRRQRCSDRLDAL